MRFLFRVIMEPEVGNRAVRDPNFIGNIQGFMENNKAESNTSQGQHVEIKCNFGMTLEDMRCHYLPLPQGSTGTIIIALKNGEE